MKIRVGVFFGGKSVEHEVSIISAIQACNNIDKEKYEVTPVYITKAGEMYVGEKIGKIPSYSNIPSLLSQSKRVILIKNGNDFELDYFPAKKLGNNVHCVIDVALPVVHGTNVEDGVLQGYFQTIGIPYAGCDVISSAVGMDKYVMKTVFKDNDIPVLDCVTVHTIDYNENNEREIARIETKVGYPVIVKPINLGSSVGITIAHDREGLLDALETAFFYASKVLCEKAITNLKEINCSVAGDYETAHASECEQPMGNDEILSFEDKYIGGGKSSGMATLKRKVPADITPERREEIRTLAVKAFRCLGCSGVARIDFMIDMDTDKVYLNEINTIPGSLAFYLWEPVGVKYSALLDEIIMLSLKRERINKSLTFSFDSNILEGFSGGKLGGAKGGKL